MNPGQVETIWKVFHAKKYFPPHPLKWALLSSVFEPIY